MPLVGAGPLNGCVNWVACNARRAVGYTPDGYPLGPFSPARSAPPIFFLPFFFKHWFVLSHRPIDKEIPEARVYPIIFLAIFDRRSFFFSVETVLELGWKLSKVHTKSCLMCYVLELSRKLYGGMFNGFDEATVPSYQLVNIIVHEYPIQ